MKKITGKSRKLGEVDSRQGANGIFESVPANTLITAIELDNFKCFAHLDVRNISRLNLISGLNNVGKSSLLEALFLLYDRGQPAMFFKQSAWRGVSTLTPDPESVWAPVFHRFSTAQKLVIAATRGGQQEALEVEYRPQANQTTFEIPAIHSPDKIPEVSTNIVPFTSYALSLTYKAIDQKDYRYHLVMRTRAEGVEIALEAEPGSEQMPPGFQSIPAVYLPAKVAPDQNDQATRFGKLDVIGKKQSIITFLQVIEPRLSDLSSVAMGQTSLLYGDIGIGRKIPLAYMGDGMSRLLAIILAMATVQNGLILLDEIENGIHHSVMEQVWKGIGEAAREFNCQVLATTHSYECIQAAAAGMHMAHISDQFRYIRLNRGDEIPEITATTYFPVELDAALESGWEVR